MTEPLALTDDHDFLVRYQRPDYESPEPKIRIVDLFCGCGGLSLGMAEAARRLTLGTDIRLAVDLDPTATSVYLHNFPSARVECVDATMLFDGELGGPPTPHERTLAESVGPVDLLVGGPPCQGHSNLNNHTRRHDPRNSLYTLMARAAEVFRPRGVLIENVPTVTCDVSQVVDMTRSALQSIQYHVHDATLDLLAMGAPQRRKRHILLAVQKQDGLDPQALLDEVPRNPPATNRTVSWAIGDLEDLTPTSLYDTPSTPSRENRARIDYLFDHAEYDLPNAERPKCHHGDHSYKAMYGRLRSNEPAPTVTTGFNCIGQGRYVHPTRRRVITPHEAARLQMIPDFWDFSPTSSRGKLAMLIGNAVPPILGIHIGDVLFTRLYHVLSFSHAAVAPTVHTAACSRHGASSESERNSVSELSTALD